jgi:hypothetical protein
MRKMLRKAFASTLLLAVVGLTFASKDGGGDKKKKSDAIPLKTEFVPIRTTNNFTLKAGPSYSGSILLSQEKTKTTISFNTLITYEKGNSIFVMPYKYRVNTPSMMDASSKTNLQLFDLHINMHR